MLGYARAKKQIARERAGIFALAFGIRDLCWGSSYSIALWLLWTETSMFAMPAEAWFGKLVMRSALSLAIPLIAYGIREAKLFDIDLRIRWTIKQSTVAAVFIAVFYLVSEGADRLLSSEFGNIMVLLVIRASRVLPGSVATIRRACCRSRDAEH